MTVNEIRFIDLFSGIGGFRLGLERNGFKHVWSNDINKNANQIYTTQFGEAGHYPGDVRGVDPQDIPDFDILCAGFPCQAFSIAGERAGFQDTRGTLFFEICRIAESKRPSLLLLENVKGLLNHDGGRTFTVILQALEELGYWVEWQVLNSKHFGVPQGRERVFIIGHYRGRGGQEVFPIIKLCKEHGNMAEETSGGREWILPTVTTKVDRYNQFYIWTEKGLRYPTPLEYERLQGFPEGWTAGISDGERYKCLGNAVTVNVVEEIGARILQSLATTARNEK